MIYDYIYANAMDAITAVRKQHLFVWLTWGVLLGRWITLYVLYE